MYQDVNSPKIAGKTVSNLSESGPHFFCIGPGNSGTTWIADQLKLQRDVWLPPIQELGYLNAGFERFRDSEHLELHWDWWSITKRVVRNKGLSLEPDRQFLNAAKDLAAVPDSPPDFALYRRLFEPAAGRITGDITPSYADLNVEDIRRFMPVLENARIFMIARDPVDRFWSALSMYWRDRVYGDRDYGSLEFVQSVVEKQARQCYLSQIVQRWREGVGSERLKIFHFDNLAADPVRTYKRIVDYIGADHRKRIPVVSPAYNRKAGQKKISASAEAREWVREHFQPELEACAELFGERGERWLKRHGHPDRG
jgi:hypothetical protein